MISIIISVVIVTYMWGGAAEGEAAGEVGRESTWNKQANIILHFIIHIYIYIYVCTYHPILHYIVAPTLTIHDTIYDVSSCAPQSEVDKPCMISHIRLSRKASSASHVSRVTRHAARSRAQCGPRPRKPGRACEGGAQVPEFELQWKNAYMNNI